MASIKRTQNGTAAQSLLQYSRWRLCSRRSDTVLQLRAIPESRVGGLTICDYADGILVG